jgi:hypothetical protein
MTKFGGALRDRLEAVDEIGFGDGLLRAAEGLDGALVCQDGVLVGALGHLLGALVVILVVAGRGGAVGVGGVLVLFCCCDVTASGHMTTSGVRIPHSLMV